MYSNTPSSSFARDDCDYNQIDFRHYFIGEQTYASKLPSGDRRERDVTVVPFEFSCVPAEGVGSERFEDVNPARQRAFLKAIETVLMNAVDSLFPSDPLGVLRAFLDSKCMDNSITEGLLVGIQSAVRGSVEKRALRGLLYAKLPGHEIERLYETLPIDILEHIVDKEEETANASDTTVKIPNRAKDPMKRRKRRFSTELATREESGGGDRGSTDDQPSIRWLQTRGSMKRTRKLARDDWISLMKHGRILTYQTDRKYFDDDVIRFAVSFIYRSDNVQLLSWGMKRVRHMGRWIEIPAVLRKYKIDTLYRRYCESITSDGTRSSMRRTIFSNVVSVITAGELKPRACIDYVRTRLVSDPIEFAKYILDRKVSDSVVREDLGRKLVAMKDYLSYGYRNHLDLTSTDPYHGPSYGVFGKRG